VIRPATAADAETIADLEAACQGVDAWSENLVREGVTGDLPTIRYLVAEQDDRIEGYAVASYAGDIAELQRIGVSEDARRTGLASALLDEVIAEAPATGANRMLLEVRSDNTGALKFYAARGFVEIDRRPRYYRDGADAIVMRLPLVTGCGGSAIKERR